MSHPSPLTWEKITLKLRNPFRLSYGVSETRQAFWIRLTDDCGWGEGTIPPYYGIDQNEMIACWERASRSDRPFPDDPQEVPDWVGQDGPAPARSALELALYDRIARQRELPLYALLGLPRPSPKATSFTIAIDTPDEMARMAKDILDYPIIKLKLGGAGDEARLAAVRSARPDARLRVDPNAGWSRQETLDRIPVLERYNLEVFEQPLDRNDIEGLGIVQAHTSITVVADESVRSLEDVDRLGEAGVKGLNVKLMKVGGLTNALKIIQHGRAYGMKIMLGCMIEMSIGITAMAALAGLADWLDLDAPLLVSNDPFEGVTFDKNANICVPERPGIGAVLKQ
jgi:L-Ala-D/L-Glu epimerase